MYKAKLLTREKVFQNRSKDSFWKKSFRLFAAIKALTSCQAYLTKGMIDTVTSAIKNLIIDLDGRYPEPIFELKTSQSPMGINITIKAAEDSTHEFVDIFRLEFEKMKKCDVQTELFFIMFNQTI